MKNKWVLSIKVIEEVDDFTSFVINYNEEKFYITAYHDGNFHNELYKTKTELPIIVQQFADEAVTDYLSSRKNETDNCIDIQDKWIQDAVKDILSFEPNADKNVLMFIFTFGYFYADNSEDYEHVRKIFRAGYCYYFALMLQSAFPGGTIVWAAPLGHIAYQYNNIVYDIEGVCNADCECFIPVKHLGPHLEDFMRVPGKKSIGTNAQQIEKIISDYKKL